MKRNYRAIKVGIGDGGHLLTDRPLASIGVENFYTCQNWRHEGSGRTAELVKREGWDWFKPDSSGDADAQKIISSGNEVQQIGEATRPNGTRVPVAASGGYLWWFDYDTPLWTAIAGGLQTTDIERWQIKNMGYDTVFNNGVDIPYAWKIGDSEAEPLTELREGGVASCRYINEYNQTLQCADVLEILPASLPAVLANESYYKPIIGDYTNLLTYSQDWTNAAWTKDNTTVAGGADIRTDPNGGTTAELILETTANSTHGWSQAVTIEANQTYTFTIYLAEYLATDRSFRVVFGDSSFSTTVAGLTWDNTTPAIISEDSTGSPTNVSISVRQAPNGYYEYTITANLGAVTSAAVGVQYYDNSSGSYTYTGSTIRGVSAWGAQLTKSSMAHPYIATTSATASVSTQRINHEIVWSNLGDARDFAATFPCASTATSADVDMDYPARSLSAGDSVVVIGAGTNGGNLVTTIASISSDGLTITLDDAAVTTVADTLILKATALSSIVGRYYLEDSGAPIVAMEKLNNRFVVYKTDAIFVGYYTGDLDEPFSYEKVYEGNRIPTFKWTVASVGGMYHLYAGDRHFYRWRLGMLEPEIDPILHQCEKAAFFNQVTTEDQGVVWTTDNPCTNELFIFRNGGILAYDYGNGKATTIDGADDFTCAASMRKPIADSRGDDREIYFVFGDSYGFATTYGRTNLQTLELTRYESPVSALWQTGIGDFGDAFNEKIVRSWAPLFSTTTGSGSTVFYLYGTDRAHDSTSLLEAKTMASSSGDPGVVNLFYSKIYFQERVVVSIDTQIRLQGRVWEVAPMRTRSTERIST